MGAYEGLSNYFDRPICNYANEFGYHNSNIIILEGNLDRLRKEHAQIYDNLITCRHHSDRRTPLQYGQDLVASWIFEDYFIAAMQNEKFSIQLSGADRTRMILPNRRTATSSDYIITTSAGNRITMELVNDYTGFWYRNHKLHLRDNKYLHLQRNHSLLLAIALSPAIQKYTIYDFRKSIPAKKISSHKQYGGKPAYELNVDQKSLYDFSFDNIRETIIDTIGEK